MTVKEFIAVSAISNTTIKDGRTYYYFDIDHVYDLESMFGRREIHIMSAPCADSIEIILKKAANT